jgi:DNA polymerase-3 subunit epsilon
MHDLDDQPLVVVDVETTGLSANFGDRVCEVGIVRAQGDTILDTFQTLVNPQRPISPGAARVNGLSDEDVCTAPRFAEIAGQVLERIDGALLLCHNAPFDVGFLDAEMARLRQSWHPSGVIDTLEIARSYFSFSSNSLPAVAARLGIRTPQAHRALGDALTTLQVFRKLYGQLAARERYVSRELVSNYRPAAFEMEDVVLPPEIQEALAANQPLMITYVDAKGAETTRMITPIQVQVAYGEIYLVAFCHLRQAERNFRLDRISSFGHIA